MTRRGIHVVAVLLAAVMLATAPAAGAHTVVVSIHTTDTDFNSATTLDNVTVSGSGTAADVDWTGDFDGTTVSRTSDDNDGSDSAREGVVINPNTDLAGVTITASSRTSGASTAYVTDTSGNVLASKSLSSGEATIAVDLDAGTDYLAVVDNDGSSYTRGFTNSVSYPYTSSDLDIVGGVSDGTTTTQSVAYAVNDVTALKNTGDGQYVGDGHDASNVVQGFTDLTLTNAKATVEWQAHDGSSWSVQRTDTYTTSGNKSVSLSGDFDQWRANVTFEPDASTDYSAQLHDEGVQATTHAPSLDDSSASPSGGEKLDSTPTYEIDGEDADFPTTQGDTVTLTWFRNGNALGTTTETSNGTWSFTPSDAVAGSNTWHVEAEDEYGHTATSSTFSYENPAELAIRDEQNGTKLIDDATVEVTFFGEDIIVQRETSDGTVDMSGLPSDQKLVAVAEANGYQTRRVIIDGLYDQQSVYLLNESATSVEVVFQLDDQTGRFTGGERTELLVQRPINRSGTTEWETIIGDEVGAAKSLPTILERDQRYRIVVRGSGESRVLGAYVATSPKDPEVLPIGSIQFDASGETGAAFSSQVVEEDGGRAVRVAYRDPEEATTDLHVKIVNQDTGAVLANTTFSGPHGTLIYTEPIPAGAPENVSYNVTYDATRANATDQNATVVVGGLSDISGRFGIDPKILSIIGWLSVAGVFGLLVPLNSRGAPVVATGLAGLLTVLNIIGPPLVVVGMAGVGAVLFVIAGRR